MTKIRTALSLLVCLFITPLLIPISNVAGAATPQLEPVSLSFPTPQHGYVLSVYDCNATTCAALRSTHDRGASWDALPLPRQLDRSLALAPWRTYNVGPATISVHFADANNGWIYGTVPAPVTASLTSPNWVTRLWSTHDGGAIWTQIRLSQFALNGGVLQMATHGTWTYLFGASFQHDHAYLLGTPSTRDAWTNKADVSMWLPAGGTLLEGAFTFAGSSGWFTAGNDRGFTPSARLSSDGVWVAWNGPTYKNYGASFSSLGAVTNRVVVAEAASAGFYYPPASSVPPGWNDGASWLFISYDAGAAFTPFRKLSSGYQEQYTTVPGLPATPRPGTILLQRRSSSGHDELIRSTNWGRSWHVVLDRSVSQVLFVSSTTGFAIVQGRTSPTTFSLFRTTTSGSSWSSVTV